MFRYLDNFIDQKDKYRQHGKKLSGKLSFKVIIPPPRGPRKDEIRKETLFAEGKKLLGDRINFVDY